ncbi:hypothetical protein CCP3SC5AM1_530014 [Gammaproteobacteria bacterium]
MYFRSYAVENLNYSARSEAEPLHQRLVNHFMRQYDAIVTKQGWNVIDTLTQSSETFLAKLRST